MARSVNARSNGASQVGQVESGRQVSLGVNEIAEPGLDLAKETMGSQADQRLIRCAGERQRFRCDVRARSPPLPRGGSEPT